MNARIGWWIGLGCMSVVAGCASDHGLHPDAGPSPDTSPPVQCRPGDAPPPDRYCVFVGSDHVCGDAAVPPACVDGAWQCPAGTGSEDQCWCSGFDAHAPSCICTPGGWSCPPLEIDAGVEVDAAYGCPDDVVAAIGTTCFAEGQSCGTCVNPCAGPCNLITCRGGTWQRQWFGCPATGFACGPGTTCIRGSQYCEHVLSDVAGEPDGWVCLPFPEDCPADCTCLVTRTGPGGCIESEGGTTITFGGG